MCLECTEGEHREHVTVPLRDVLEQHKAALKNQLDAIRNRFEQQQSNMQKRLVLYAIVSCRSQYQDMVSAKTILVSWVRHPLLPK